MRTALVIPSLGAPQLDDCLQAVARLAPRPDHTIVVLSGTTRSLHSGEGITVVTHPLRLGFAAAVNLGITRAHGIDALAVLNDDAQPDPDWLARLVEGLRSDDRLAAVQGTVTDASGTHVDGRGISFDPWGLPIQRDRGLDVAAQPSPEAIVAVSATACLYRWNHLAEAFLTRGTVFDPAFGSYHEDLDLGLRLVRLGYRAAWIDRAPVRHIGSASGVGLRWRHPWWILANRWRTLAGNLQMWSFIGQMPRWLRGEARAIRTLARTNLRALGAAGAVAAALPYLIASGWHRSTGGPRLRRLPGLDS